MTKTHHIILGQLTAGALTLLVTVVSARQCGPKVLAECLSMILILSVVLDLADFGTCSWSARELAASKIKLNFYFELMFSRVFVTLLTAPITIAFCLFGSMVSKELATLSIYPTLWLITNYVQQFLLVNERIYFAQTLQILERLSWLLIFPLSYLGINKYFLFLLPILVGLFLHSIVGLSYIAIKFLVDFKSLRFRLVSYRNSRHFGGLGIITDVGNLDTPIITALSTLSEAGSYSLAQRFRNPSQLPFQAISIRVRNYATNRNGIDVAKYLNSEKLLIILSTLGLILLSVVSYFYANQIFGSSYKNLNLILCVSFLSAIPSGLNLILSSTLTGLGYESYVMKIVLCSVILNILGCILTASLFNALVTVLYLFASNCILLTGFLKLLRKIRRYS